MTAENEQRYLPRAPFRMDAEDYFRKMSGIEDRVLDAVEPAILECLTEPPISSARRSITNQGAIIQNSINYEG